MKNLPSLFAIICISFTTVAADRPYNRLDRLHNSDPSRCLKVSKRYIKYLPDNAVPYYFDSIVYRDKANAHPSIKTRYLMISKSKGYAMKFQNIITGLIHFFPKAVVWSFIHLPINGYK